MALEGKMVDAAPTAAERRMIMSIKCLMNGLEVNYPCSPSCALFGDCVTAFESQKKSKVRTNADRIREMSDYELAQMLAVGKWTFTCFKCLEFRDGECSMKCVDQCLEWLQQTAEGE